MPADAPKTAGWQRKGNLAWALPAALGIGLLLRLALLAVPRAYQADEIFQYLEQAHRLVFGYGVIPWEYRTGIRSWLFPLALAGPMALGGWLAPATGAYLLLPKLLIVLLSLTIIGSAHALGRRISPLHGLVAALVAACCSEFALFATQALTDSVALALFLPGAALLYAKATPGRSAASGALLALACLVRIQDMPAILLFVALVCRSDRQRWLWGIAGALPVVLLSAAVDWAMGQMPFAWVAANFHENVVVGRSHLWGVEKPTFYLKAIGKIWTFALPPIVLLAWLGARRYPALLAMAIAHLAIMSLIAHKEYRYILPSTATIVVLAALGSGDAILWARARWPRGPWLMVALGLWAAASILISRPRFVAYDWSQATPSLQAFAVARDLPGLCGLAVHGIWWSHTGGYAYLHRPVPLYLPDLRQDGDRAVASGAPSFNALVAPPRATGIPASFHAARCFGQASRFPDQAACLYVRAGSCDPAPSRAFAINTALLATDR
jgi:hypothetical protein